MRIAIAAITAATATLSLAGCGSDAPVKRQPGSWSQKMEVIEFTGPGITPAQKAQMQRMMEMVSKMTVCLTPDTVAREDIEKNLTNLGGAAGNCVVADKQIGGGKVSFTANCNEPGKGGATGKRVRMTVAGTNSATEQSFRVTVESTDASSDGGKLVMNVSGKREGECKPGELTPPPPPTTPPATPAKAAS